VENASNSPSENNEGTSNRKNFIIRMAMGIGLISSFATGALYALKFLVPERKKTRYRKILITSLENLPPNTSKIFHDLSGREIVLVNTGKGLEGLKAISTECTHLGCKVYYQPDKDRFFCPCHDGVFDLNGKVKSGPPPEDLKQYSVIVDEHKKNVFVLVKEI